MTTVPVQVYAPRRDATGAGAAQGLVTVDLPADGSVAAAVHCLSASSTVLRLACGGVDATSDAATAVACFGRPGPAFPLLPLRSAVSKPVAVFASAGQPLCVAPLSESATAHAHAATVEAPVMTAAQLENDHRKLWHLTDDEADEVRETLTHAAMGLEWNSMDAGADAQADLPAFVANKVKAYVKGGHDYQLQMYRSPRVCWRNLQRNSAGQGIFQAGDNDDVGSSGRSTPQSDTD